MVPGVKATTRYTGHGDDSDSGGWNGWLYPLLFVGLPILAALMVLILIACNVYEYYQNKKRLQQYRQYDQRPNTALNSVTNKPTNGSEFDDNIGHNGFNESNYTYNAIFGNYMNSEESKGLARPMSGWVAPHI